ncbi:MAG: nuclear transport factor 2 family protein [Bacteroidota bacterium]
MMKILFPLLFFPLLAFSQTADGVMTDAELEREISKMDSLLFEEAFNNCNFELFKSILVDGIEFYDDRTGLNTDLAKEYASFQDKCSRPLPVTRKLIQHSVHRLGEFGALQKGTHIFLNDGQVVQSAQFVTIWKKTETSWIVSRAMSYEHKDL